MTLSVNVATPTSFELVVPNIPITHGDETGQILLQLFNAVIPSLDVTDEIFMQWQGHRAGTDPGGGIIFNDWMASFFVDADFTNWYGLYRWIMYTVRGDLMHHSIHPTLFVKDNFGSNVLVVDFIGAWIKSLGEVTLNTQSGEEYLQSTFTLSYNEYKVRRPTDPITSELPEGHVL